jgi:nucleotide-binding universal stress UspA family protein
MFKINKILYPTDFSRCSEQAMLHALHLAWRYQAEVHMLHVIVLHEYDPQKVLKHFSDDEHVFDSLRQKAKQQMITTIKEQKADELPIKIVQQNGISTAPVILEYAEKNDIDLIVMGTHGRRGLGHLFLGSVAEEVVRLAPCPVCTIREMKEPIPVHALKHILVPTDFSDYSKLSIQYGLGLAETYNAKLQLLHIVEQEIHPAHYVTGKTSIFDFNPDIKKISKKVMQDSLKEHNNYKIPADFYVNEGHAAYEIVKFAKTHDTDLIVIPTHGLTGLKHLFIGSVAEKVVRMAPCKVFTVKSFGKSLI